MFSRHFDLLYMPVNYGPSTKILRNAFENNCYRKLFQVHYTMHTTDVEIHGTVTDWEECHAAEDRKEEEHQVAWTHGGSEGNSYKHNLAG